MQQMNSDDYGTIQPGWYFQHLSTPLKNDGVSQLGWWHSQYMEKLESHEKFHGSSHISSHHQPATDSNSIQHRIPQWNRLISMAFAGSSFARRRTSLASNWRPKSTTWGYSQHIYPPVNQQFANWEITIFFVGKSTLKWAMFNSHVSLPEGIYHICIYI